MTLPIAIEYELTRRNIASAVLCLRTNGGMSQQKLAEEINKASAASICQYEREIRTTPLDDISRIAETFGYKVTVRFERVNDCG